MCLMILKSLLLFVCFLNKVMDNCYFLVLNVNQREQQVNQREQTLQLL